MNREKGKVDHFDRQSNEKLLMRDNLVSLDSNLLDSANKLVETYEIV